MISAKLIGHLSNFLVFKKYNMQLNNKQLNVVKYNIQLQVLSQQRADNFEPRKTVRNEPTTSSFHSDSLEGKLCDFLFFIS